MCKNLDARAVVASPKEEAADRTLLRHRGDIMPVDSLKRNFFIFDSHTYECTYRMMMPMAASLLEYFEPTQPGANLKPTYTSYNIA